MRSSESWSESILLASPAAGTALTYRIPGETWTRLQIARWTLTTSAAVANRYPSLDILNGDNRVIFRAMTPNVQVASLTRGLTYVPEGQAFALSPGGEELGPLPRILIPPGFSIRLTAAALDAADTITLATIHVERIPSANWEPAPGSTPYYG